MSRADLLFMENCREILTHGVWDTDREVRPRWEDGSPAHTVKAFGLVNRYDLREEFPLLTLRRTYWKTAVKELLWIWQKKRILLRRAVPGTLTRAKRSARAGRMPRLI